MSILESVKKGLGTVVASGFLMAGLLACEGQQNHHTNEEMLPEPDMSYSFHPPAAEDDLPDDKRLERLKLASEMQHEVRNILLETDSWEKADEKVRSLTNKHTGLDEWARNQIISTYMMGELMDQEPSAELMESMEFHVDQLVNTGSPELEMIYSGVTQLEGHISQEQTIAWSRQVVNLYEERMQKGELENDYQNVDIPEDVQDHQDARMVKRDASFDQLQQLAEK